MDKDKEVCPLFLMQFYASLFVAVHFFYYDRVRFVRWFLLNECLWLFDDDSALVTHVTPSNLREVVLGSYVAWRNGDILKLA